MARWIESSRAIARVLEAAAGSFESAVEQAGGRAADRLERTGRAVQEAFRSTRRSGFAGEVVAGLTDLASVVTKGGFGIVAGGAAGILRMGAGLPLLDARRLVSGSLDVGSSAGGAVVLVAGTLVSLIQRLLLLQNNERQLTSAERDLLEQIFGHSVSLDNVRIVEGRCGLFGLSRRPFAMGNTIYFKAIDPRTRPDILVHECVHVWQYQNTGARYVTDALAAQAVYGAGAYDWRAEIDRGARSWNEFNKEAQAALIQEIWSRSGISFGGRDRVPPAAGTTELGKFVVGGRDYTELARASIAALRSRSIVRRSMPPSDCNRLPS